MMSNFSRSICGASSCQNRNAGNRAADRGERQKKQNPWQIELPFPTMVVRSHCLSMQRSGVGAPGIGIAPDGPGQVHHPSSPSKDELFGRRLCWPSPVYWYP